MTDTKNETVSDKTPINFQIRIVGQNVVLDFGRDVSWVGFTKKEALHIAKFMRKAALSL